MSVAINNLINFSRSLPAPFDTLTSKKVKVSSKYGSGTEATLSATVIKAVHAVCDCMTGIGEGALGVIDHRMVAEYRTTPAVGTTMLAKQLLAEGHYLPGVPGFYHNTNGEWSFIRESRGIMIPVRSPEGKIQGIQVRRDNLTKRKFRWISSVGKPDGTPAEGWTHLAGTPQEAILLTEGPLKADVIHHLTGYTVLAVPGVNSLSQLKTALEYMREHGTRQVMTAFDMDYLSNPHVQNGYMELTRLLSEMDFHFGTYLWDPQYKGLDDYVWEHCYHQG